MTHCPATLHCKLIWESTKQILSAQAQICKTALYLRVHSWPCACSFLNLLCSCLCQKLTVPAFILKVEGKVKQDDSSLPGQIKQVTLSVWVQKGFRQLKKSSVWSNVLSKAGWLTDKTILCGHVFDNIHHLSKNYMTWWGIIEILNFVINIQWRM